MPVLDGVIKESEELVILALADRVELVIMALRATDRQAEERRSRRVNPVDDRLDAELFGIDSAFLIDLGGAMEAGGNLLFERGVGQQVACELLNHKLVKRQIAIERVDHPITIFPN